MATRVLTGAVVLLFFAVSFLGAKLYEGHGQSGSLLYGCLNPPTPTASQQIQCVRVSTKGVVYTTSTSP